MNCRGNRSQIVALTLLSFGAVNLSATVGLPRKQPKKSSAQMRADYLTMASQAGTSSFVPRTEGSLWSASGFMVDPASDYKAHAVDDLVTVLVSVQTTAAQSGSINSGRDFSTNSAVAGIAGTVPKGTNPLFTAQSSSTLKGSGAANSSTAFNTSLSGQIIAVLANGNLVIEAQRQIAMNNQHEEVVVRGIVRPGDISSGNTVPSSSLSALQVELKGKGIISDSVRPPNPLTRAILWLFGF